MSSLLIVALLATFGAVMTGVLAIGAHASGRRRALQLLEASVGTVHEPSPDLRGEALKVSLVSRIAGSAMSNLKPVAVRIAPTAMRDRIAHKLVKAGSPSGWDAEKVIAVRLLAVLGGPITVMLLLTSGPPVLRLAAIAMTAYIGYFGPEIVIDRRIEARQSSIRRALPDTLDLLTISVEAGLGFDAALSQVMHNVPGALSMEIARAMQEMQLGVSRADAFRNLNARTEVDELKSLVLAIIQADAFGISVSKVLRAQAHEQRTKRRQRTEERAMKIPVKILFPLITCVLPSMFIVVLGPGVIRIVQQFMGLETGS